MEILYQPSKNTMDLKEDLLERSDQQFPEKVKFLNCFDHTRQHG
jgi:hypothetical protein